MTSPECSNAHIVIAGWDEQSSAKNMDVSGESPKDSCKYVLCEILPGGSRMDMPVVVAGSGSTLIASLVEENLQNTAAESVAASIDQRGDQRDERAELYDHSRPLPVATDTASASNVKLPFTQLTIEQVVPRIKQSLRLAARIDPQTGGDKLHVWHLSHM